MRCHPSVAEEETVFNTVHTQREIAFPEALKNGSQGPAVRRLQEWLGFNRFPTGIDSDFGDGTERALRQFQQAHQLPASGQLDPATWSRLVQPMTSALEVQPTSSSLAGAVKEVAKAHLAQGPIELGGDNRGPWVRMYMDGRDGPEWRWCAGFVFFVLRQACAALDKPVPFPVTFSCDSLAANARQAGRLCPGEEIASGRTRWADLGPFAIFLVRRSPGDWCHTGFAEDGSGSAFATIEGNTNDDGSSNGFEVCARSRSLKDKDFVVVT